MARRRPRPAFAVLLLAGLAGPAHAAPPERTPAPSREGIESLGAQLDRAAARVSVPQIGILLGRADTARGYRLPGYGVVFVLTPRLLPGDEGAVYVLHHGRPGPGSVRVVTPPPAAGAPPPVRVDVDGEGQDVEVLERQVLVLQREAEDARRAAEEDMDRMVREVRVRVTPGPDTAPAAAPAPPAAPEPPSAEVPPPPPPPWKFWFEAEGPQDTRAPDRVVADVRAALVDVLESQAGRLRGLGPQEFVTVAVDFLPGSLFAAHARPARTLVVRARLGDLQARARGALTPEDLRRRVEVVEY